MTITCADVDGMECNLGDDSDSLGNSARNAKSGGGFSVTSKEKRKPFFKKVCSCFKTVCASSTIVDNLLSRVPSTHATLSQCSHFFIAPPTTKIALLPINLVTLHSLVCINSWVYRNSGVSLS